MDKSCGKLVDKFFGAAFAMGFSPAGNRRTAMLGPTVLHV